MGSKQLVLVDKSITAFVTAYALYLASTGSLGLAIFAVVLERLLDLYYALKD